MASIQTTSTTSATSKVMAESSHASSSMQRAIARGDTGFYYHSSSKIAKFEPAMNKVTHNTAQINVDGGGDIMDDKKENLNESNK